jgi:Family of unknown function (DUF5995)
MPANSISEVIDQLNEIVIRSAASSDRAGYFAALYKRVTVAVAEKIKQGYFDDNARMEKMDVVFANRYLEAYQNYKSGNPCTGCWCLAFDATKSWRPMVIHHLLTGMNAHISLDLGIAAATVSPGASVTEIQNDFYKINIVLSEMIDEVKADLFAMWPLSKFIVRLKTDKLENAIAGFSMTIARDAAWQQALDYAPLTIPANQQSFISARDQKVTAFGKSLLHPGLWISTVISILRVFEFGSVSSKIKRLNT